MRKTNLIILAMAASAGCTLWQPSFAQSVQGWQNAEQNEINQAQSVGALNQRQAERLDSQEAAINAQKQRDLMQNGGHLTNYERAQLGNELNQVNNHINRDEFHDARRRGEHHGQWRNGMQGQFPGGMPGQFPNGVQPGYPAYTPNAYVPNANGFVPPNAGGFVPNANGYVPNANGYMPNANGYAPNGFAPNPSGYNQNGNGQRAGGMLNKLEQLIGGQNNGRNF